MAEDTTTEDELLEATGQALQEHGVGDLTTQKIADEWGRAQSLVHYYYDTKEELVVAHIDHLRAELVSDYESQADDPPLERLRRFFAADLAEPADGPDLGTVLLELHAAAPHNDAYRRALDDLEDAARRFVEGAVRDGIEAGVLRDVDPAATAVLLLSAHDGALVRARMLRRSDDADLARAGLDAYLRECLLAEDATVDSWLAEADDADGAREGDG